MSNERVDPSHSKRESPPPDPAGELEEAWREQVLRSLLRVGAVLGFSVVAFAFSRQGLDELGSIWWVLLVGVGVFGALALAPGRLRRLRAWVLVATLYAIGTWGLATLGFLLGPGLTLALAVTVSVLFLSPRVAWWVLGITTATVLGVGVAMNAGLLPPVEDFSTRAGDIWNWVRTTIVYATLGAMPALAMHFVLNRKAKIIREKSAALARAEQEQREREEANRARRSAEDALMEARKLEAVGTLAGGIAHDFNNILGAVMGYAELARMDAQGNPTVREELDEIVRASARAKELVNQILTLSRQREGERRLVHLQAVLAEAAILLRAAIPASVRMQVAVDEDCGPVLGDGTQLYRVVMNLCTNAYQAMGEKGGRLDVTLRSCELSEGLSSSLPPLPPGRYVELCVSDTGPGMDAEIGRRAFDPYFTTKHQYEGTGLGLALVHGIVQAHGGGVDLETRSGQGATFRVLLPVHVGPAPEQDAATDGLESPRGSARVLFVDDEPPLARVAKRTLERLGYTVTSCTSAEEAWEDFRARSNEFDIVVTDVSMPDMNGVEFAGRITKLRPRLPVIACTGYGDAIAQTDLANAGIRLVVAKPFLVGDLARSIRALLEQQS